MAAQVTGEPACDATVGRTARLPDISGAPGRTGSGAGVRAPGAEDQRAARHRRAWSVRSRRESSVRVRPIRRRLVLTLAGALALGACAGGGSVPASSGGPSALGGQRARRGAAARRGRRTMSAPPRGRGRSIVRAAATPGLARAGRRLAARRLAARRIRAPSPQHGEPQRRGSRDIPDGGLDRVELAKNGA